MRRHAVRLLGLIDCSAVGGVGETLGEGHCSGRQSAAGSSGLIRFDTDFGGGHDSRARPARRPDGKGMRAWACNWVLAPLVHERLSSLVMGFFLLTTGGAYALQCKTQCEYNVHEKSSRVQSRVATKKNLGLPDAPALHLSYTFLLPSAAAALILFCNVVAYAYPDTPTRLPRHHLVQNLLSVSLPPPFLPFPSAAGSL